MGIYRHKRAEVDWLRKLRWVTLGYHYDWDRKVAEGFFDKSTRRNFSLSLKIYHKERVSKFPDDLSALSKFIAELFRFPR